MTWLLAGLLLGVLGAGWYGFERLERASERTIAILEADRDQARAEARTFRNLLYPGIARVEAASEGAKVAHASSSPGPKANTQAPPSQAASAMGQLFNRKTPFRLRFKRATRMMNTPQQKTNALADALRKIPQQEKVNA